MKNSTLIIVAVIVAASVYYLVGYRQTPTMEKTGSTVESNQSTNTAMASPTPVKIDNTTGTSMEKIIDIKAQNYSYDVKEIKVKLNDQVKINFTNVEGVHDLKIDEFNVATKVIKAGESESITFAADKAGTYEYYCSVGQHRANGMWGKLIVE